MGMLINKVNTKNSQRGQALILLIVVLLIVGAGFMVGGFNQVKTQEVGQTFPATVVTLAPDQNRSNLQLKTLEFSAPCGHDNGQSADNQCSCPEWKIKCVNKECVTVIGTGGVTVNKDCRDYIGAPPGQDPDTYSVLNDICANHPEIAPADGVYCVAKPVIYLYPEQNTLVNVNVETTGKIVVSDPLYPEGGWKNVLAEPNGKLTYQGKTYKELFYESSVSTFTKPTNGIIIANSNLNEKIKEVINNLGLNENEQQEFLDFWVPKLKALKSNYILFSVIDPSTKEKIDKVIVNPQPTTRIEFIAYFKPLDMPMSITPLKLPTRPERIGFTEVEWGGTIDLSKNSTIN